MYTSCVVRESGLRDRCHQLEAHMKSGVLYHIYTILYHVYIIIMHVLYIWCILLCIYQLWFVKLGFVITAISWKRE